MTPNDKLFDVIIVGAGHAGCEAANATAKMGFKTLLLTIDFNNIAFMPCNPSLGGPAKANLVREVDALGGLMGRVADLAHLQFRELNTHKGPAVRALRAQMDKRRYQEIMQHFLEKEKLISLRQGEVVSLKRTGEYWRVIMSTGVQYETTAVILATGTFLRGLVHIGLHSFPSGPLGQHPANALSEFFQAEGLCFRRFKTGTPARVRKRSLNFSAMIEQPGDHLPYGFSYWIPWQEREQVSCWLTYTNASTHQIIRDNLDRAALFSGAITGVGPRYCPSIESKLINFPQKERHQVFIEPEARYTDEMYVSGASTSLDEEIQDIFLRTIPGLENVEIVRPGYAIEYDVIPSNLLTPSLALKDWPGVFFAGQINGSSGYEEAAAQGIMAGINAGLYLKGEEPFILRRDEAYIGVLIDDLVTKDTLEPYRIMTSRAEFRLSLRQENANHRLTDYGYKYGLISEEEYELFQAEKNRIQQAFDFLNHHHLSPDTPQAEALFKEKGVTVKKKTAFRELLRRPEISYSDFADPETHGLKQREIEVIENAIKYQGYLEREKKMADKLRKMEMKRIPPDFDYNQVPNLSTEAKEKLTNLRPVTLGQASRISGVSPADISAILIWLSRR
ncbi:MAG TPA: tRNA uridine-5-carboxymethylaminomethyl(34) synthesis enzyme MnmG [Firmicutes bacterium]|jgi:tRNA uridine 5-carboxymethylaminomethyl modification enzyme|nr:tRNA uridine-5-carboxymethylaminomethyl(34) synthesis enzyme MnmG [Bacillota bacterium]